MYRRSLGIYEILIDNWGRRFAQGSSGPRSIVCLDCQGAWRWKQWLTAWSLSGFICDRENVVYTCSRYGVDAYGSEGNHLWRLPFRVGASSTRVSCPAIGADGTMYVGTYTNYPYTESCVVAIE